MVKRLKRKLKGVEVEITFAEPREYDNLKKSNRMKRRIRRAIEKLSKIKDLKVKRSTE